MGTKIKDNKGKKTQHLNTKGSTRLRKIHKKKMLLYMTSYTHDLIRKVTNQSLEYL